MRALAQALLDRGLSADRPVVILSGNSIEHALLALAAMYAGVLYAPIAPAYSLLARDFTTLRADLWHALRPGLVFAADGAPFERGAVAASAGGAEIVTCAPAAALRATAVRRARGRRRPTGGRRRRARAGRARHDRQDPVHVGIDRAARRA